VIHCLIIRSERENLARMCHLFLEDCLAGRLVGSAKLLSITSEVIGENSKPTSSWFMKRVETVGFINNKLSMNGLKVGAQL
jgi:hypothetical protein